VRRWFFLRWTGVVLAGVAALAAVLAVATPLGRYLVRAAWEEGKILAGRRSIAALVEDPATEPVLRAKLQLVLEARQFAVDSLGFPAGKSFTQFTQLERDTLVLVLSGAAKDALTPVLWRFPVVGRLPYKGFFRLEDALAAERGLAERGFDTNLRPASAFSTLGWFNDPLLSTTVRADSVDLVNTVIHELMHNKYFAPGDAAFNESLANFVGARGAEWFFAARGDSVRAARAAARWADDRLLAAFWGALYRELDSAFAAHPGDSLRARRIAVRDSVYMKARLALVEDLSPQWRTIAPVYAERVRLDNAALLARRLYLTDLERFEGELARCAGRLVCAIDALVEEHRSMR
jgi:predicted aminopeptidase